MWHRLVEDLIDCGFVSVVDQLVFDEGESVAFAKDVTFPDAGELMLLLNKPQLCKFICFGIGGRILGEWISSVK